MREKILPKIKSAASCIKYNARTVCVCAFSAVCIAVFMFVALSVNVVSINCGDTTLRKMYTFKADPAGIVTAAGYSDGYTIENVNVNGKTIDINITESFPVYVTYDGYTVSVNVTGGSTTVLDVLLKTGLEVDTNDLVSLPYEQVLTETAYIDIVSIDGVETTVEEYTEEKEQKEELEKAGLTEKEYKKMVSEGPAAPTAAAVTETAAPATPGTAVSVSNDDDTISTLSHDLQIALDENGVPVNYTKKMVVEATAYTYTGHKCSTGVAPQPGYIAVNPKVIPYGTKLYIKSCDGKYIYGYAVAADTGGFIKTRPQGVDLFMTTRTQCLNFGRRNVEIYFLE